MFHHRLAGSLFNMAFGIGILLLLAATQIFWIQTLREGLRRIVSSRRWRWRLGAGALVVYAILVTANLVWPWVAPRPRHSATAMTIETALLDAPFTWWIFGSVAGAAIAGCFGLVDYAARGWRFAASRLKREAGSGVRSLARRHFLGRTSRAMSALPFVAGAYGILYGRLDVELTHRPIRLRRLPRAFNGFRLAQLSDLHIGPFMSAAEIRRCADLVNGLRPDLIALTGDFVTWDPGTQEAVVAALSGLRAPYGVFGCLGNHELWTKTEDSITRLFAARNIKILRQERQVIRTDRESLNLIGVDFQTHGRMGRHGEGFVRVYLEGIEALMDPDTVNILFSHNPNTFDRAAELGIDLSLAGHTHGGQVALEFVSPEISPSRLITPYVAGWFAKGGGQLYVNRGIGTIGIPIRLGASPEITLYELVCAA